MSPGVTRAIGAIPPPELLLEYEKLVPGASDQILRMAERTLEHNLEFQERIERSLERERIVIRVLGVAMFAILGGAAWFALKSNLEFLAVLTSLGAAAISGLATVSAYSSTKMMAKLAQQAAHEAKMRAEEAGKANEEALRELRSAT